MPADRNVLWAGMLIAAAGCGDANPPNPVREALAQEPDERPSATAVALRFPARSTTVRLYRLPGLEETAFQFNSGVVADEVVGYAPADYLMYLLNQDRGLFALDLRVGTASRVDSAAIRATLAPMGTATVIRSDFTIADVEQRRSIPWGDTLHALPTEVWGAWGGRLLGKVASDGDTTFRVWREGDEPVTLEAVGRDPKPSTWGEAILSLADSGLFLHDPRGRREAQFLKLEQIPRLAIFSRAGHFIFAVWELNRVHVLNRFDGTVTDSIDIEGPIGDLRTSPDGRILLVRSAATDQIWIVDALRRQALTEVRGDWSRDLPSVAPDGTLLLRVDDDLVSYAPPEYQTAARVEGGGRDRWATIAWEPTTPRLDLGQDSITMAALPGQLFYVQVSSTSNESWADDMARKLRSAGVDASVLAPEPGEEQFKVVVGPYQTREEAEEIGRKLGMSYWVFIREPDSPVDTAGTAPEEAVDSVPGPGAGVG